MVLSVKTSQSKGGRAVILHEVGRGGLREGKLWGEFQAKGAAGQGQDRLLQSQCSWRLGGYRAGRGGAGLVSSWRGRQEGNEMLLFILSGRKNIFFLHPLKFLAGAPVIKDRLRKVYTFI